MSYKPRTRRSNVACIEMMESRQLLSASLSPAAHVTKPIPSIAGETFTGTAKALGEELPISVVFGTETAKGAFTATVTADGRTGSSIGTVKSTGAISWHGKSGKVSFSLHGTLNTTTETITGKYTDTGKKGSISGPFTMTLVEPA